MSSGKYAPDIFYLDWKNEDDEEGDSTGRIEYIRMSISTDENLALRNELDELQLAVLNYIAAVRNMDDSDAAFAEMARLVSDE